MLLYFHHRNGNLSHLSRLFVRGKQQKITLRHAHTQSIVTVCHRHRGWWRFRQATHYPLQCSNQQTSMLVWGVDLLKAYAPPANWGYFLFVSFLARMVKRIFASGQCSGRRGPNQNRTAPVLMFVLHANGTCHGCR